MLRISLAQINPTVGHLTGNTAKILAYTALALKKGAQLAVFPELAVCGYPPEDLLLKKHFVTDNIKALDALAKKIVLESEISDCENKNLECIKEVEAKDLVLKEAEKKLLLYLQTQNQKWLAPFGRR